MSIVSGLSAMTSLIEEANTGDFEKAKWFKLSGGQSVKVWFLQELEDSASGFNEKAGLGGIIVEHSNPENFKRKAQCTIDSEGQCYACQRAASDRKWKSRGRLYVNVLIDNGKDDPYVAILSQGLSDKSVTPALLMHAEDNGSITDCGFRVKRTGTEMNNTSYAIMPLPKEAGANPDEYELYDLERAASRSVPFDEQEAFYNGSAEDKPSDGSGPAPSTATASLEW